MLFIVIKNRQFSDATFWLIAKPGRKLQQGRRALPSGLLHSTCPLTHLYSSSHWESEAGRHRLTLLSVCTALCACSRAASGTRALVNIFGQRLLTTKQSTSCWKCRTAHKQMLVSCYHGQNWPLPNSTAAQLLKRLKLATNNVQ